MPWKPIVDQLVVANLGGKVRQFVVTAWNSDSEAVQVDWPPPVVVSPLRSSARKTKIEKHSMGRSTPTPSEPPPRVSAPTWHALGSGDQTASLSLLADRTVTDQ